MNKAKTTLLLLTSIVLVLLIYRGTRNQIDPDWIALEEQLDQEHFSLAVAEDSLFHLYQHIHGPSADRDTMSQRLSTPFLPTMEFTKFKSIVDQLTAKRKLVLSSTNGSGTSTLVDRVAKFMATGEDYIMRVSGAVGFGLVYHYRYIGEAQQDGSFHRGQLLQFFDRCRENPDKKFVFYFDDIEKIEPETFFGPELWSKFGNPDEVLNLGGEQVTIPDNLYFITITHVKPTAQFYLTDEHFRRLGDAYLIRSDEQELIMYLQEQLAGENQALSNHEGAKRLVYAFQKINEIIADKYNSTYTIGQWTSVRNMYDEKGIASLFDLALIHVNAFAPEEEMDLADLTPVQYALDNGGKLAGSNFFNRQFQLLEEKGFLTEFLVGLSFVLFSAISGFFIFRRREKIISNQIQRVETLFREFEDRARGYDAISEEIYEVKRRVDELALSKKINYQEATFFYQFFYDKSRKIEIAKEAQQHFRDLVEVSLDDGILSEYEYNKLRHFLDRIKTRIGTKDFDQFEEELGRLYEQHSG